MKESSYRTLKRKAIATDLLILTDILQDINWKPINNISFNRIIYYSLVTMNFITNDDDNNIYFKLLNNENRVEYYYDFSPESAGPICSEIQFVSSNLVDRGQLILSNGSFRSNVDHLSLTVLPNYKEKMKLFKNLSNLLVYYGEYEIYDLLFKDLNFRKYYDSNNSKIHFENNLTFDFLTELKNEFEKNIGNSTLEEYSYLKMYFDFAMKSLNLERGEK
jgi:hypothetical protein